MPPSAKSRSKAQGRRRRPMTFEDLMSVDRVSAPRVCPDGRSVAYVTTRALILFHSSRSASNSGASGSTKAMWPVHPGPK